MFRILIYFAAGFATAKIFSGSGSVEKIKKAAKKNTEKIKNTSKKVAQAVKEEFGKKGVEKPEENSC